MRNLKQNIMWFWRNLEKALIVIFFLTFTLNIRKVFLTPYSFFNGGFNEYMTMSFSWADLLMLATIVIYTTKSIFSQVINSYYASPGHAKVFEKSFKNVSRETFILVIFLAWVGLSIFWSQFRPIALYRFLTLAEIALFALIAVKLAVKSLKNSKWLKIALLALILNGLFQSLLGIAQFIHNGSLGLHFLGESIIGPNIDGVAKIIIYGEKHIRAYGTMPHPNILAGFLLIPLFLLIGEFFFRRLLPLYKGETERESDTNCQNLTPTLSLLRRGGLDKVSRETLLSYFPGWLLCIILISTGLGFILTFSRSAFLGFFGGLAIYFIWQTINYNSILSPFVKGGQRGILKSQPKKNPSSALSPRLNFGEASPLQKGERRKYLVPLLSLVVLLIFTFFILKNTSFFSSQSLEERNLYQNVSYETILSHPARGIGIGQFVLNEYNKHPNWESWQYQPVHNVYLLVFSELGVVGLILFLLFLVSLILKIYRDGRDKERYILTYSLFYCIIFSFLIISLFDHYFWDIKLGTLIFVLPVIFARVVAAKARPKSEN